MAPGAAPQAATMPAPAFEVNKRVKAAGVVRFPLGLRGEAGRIYRTGGAVELQLETMFTAADGTITTMQGATRQAPILRNAAYRTLAAASSGKLPCPYTAP